MFDIKKLEMDWCGEHLSLETGKVAKQTDGAVIATYGETKVLCTVVGSKEVKEGIDFFPLTVHYREMYFAAGKIPGGFFKREGRPSEKEVLTSRLIDRPIRPMFPEGFFNEVQVICTVLSYDGKNDPDMVAMIGASAALTISGVPFQGPIAGIRVGMKEGELVFNPSVTEIKELDLDLLVAGTNDSVLMVESEASELSEEKMLEAVTEGHKQLQPVIKLINDLKKQAGKEAWDYTPFEFDAKLVKEVEKVIKKDVEAAYKDTNKQARTDKLSAAKVKVEEAFADNEEIDISIIKKIYKKIQQDIVRGNILKDGARIDGRDTKTVRPIETEVGYLPRSHGSALFTRGETQAIVVTTLGGTTDEQIVDTMAGDYRDNFMLHYNFLPYSVGENTMLRPPGRREVGHGKLAWRAMNPMLPSKEDFPYTIRTVSEITESNGSSSMATVCGASLSMMDAGVPLRSPVAGIAMGLVKEGKDFVVLSDIMGDEDHLGDMDFKVAGTNNGITALQMDIKISGITPDIMKVALDQAKVGRLHILDRMSASISTSREEVSQHAPMIIKIQLPKDKVGGVIGPGGKMIRAICEASEAKVDINDDNMAIIAAPNGESADIATKMIKDIIDDPEVGQVYDGKVVKIMDFGAFVSYFGSKEGLVHISEIKDEKISSVEEHLSEGDSVKVKLVGIDDRGKAKLSMRLVNQETGEVLEDTRPKREDRGDRPQRSDRNDRGGKRFDNKRGGGNRRSDDSRHGDKKHHDKNHRDSDREPKKEKKEEKSTFRKLFKF
ncbi:MAG: polyribonucleotide nucleotidyltransferase [Rickettsiales bacterium]